jgi:hypothetical protein
MNTINETAQPVNPAITEADVVAFFASQQKAISAEFPEASLSFYPGKFVLSSYVKTHIYENGATVAEAAANHRAKIAELIPTAAKLRAEAAAKLAEADAIEAKQGGAL